MFKILKGQYDTAFPAAEMKGDDRTCREIW